jgi:hypothetical protein
MGNPPDRRRISTLVVAIESIENAAGHDDQQDEENQDHTRGRERTCYTGHGTPSLNAYSGCGLR